MMQTVFLQGFKYVFKIPVGHHLVTPTVPGSILMKCDLKKKLISISGVMMA